ncbi:hypothetical protein [Flavobacterium psychrotrophum]|uniref:hypothetical protein n=1 Tax=Flavobacterium psychrotrophum TaxID=2294119 RepID=UPI000E3155AB|nr:hypothetical protein [Flavobacterium psychrotrophum]
MKKIIEKYSTKPVELFETLFITFLFGYLPFALIHIIFNISGIIPVNFNNKDVYGLLGTVVIIIFIPFIVLLLTSIIWIYFMIGNLFLRLLKKMFL